MEQNMFSEGIVSTIRKFKEIKGNFFVCIIEALSLTIVLLLLVLLWPLGLLPLIASVFWELVLKYKNDIKNSESLLNTFPLTISMSIFFLLLLPFFILSLPMYIIGGIGGLISGRFGN
jgi:hypothetical protein